MIIKIHPVELLLYFSIWIFANFFSLYQLFVSQTNILKNVGNQVILNDLRPGWPLINRLKDVSDIEWCSWKYIIQKLWFYLIVQFTISEVIRHLCSHFLKLWYITSTILFVILQMGYKQLLIISAQPLIYATIIMTGGKKTSIWITSIFLLLSYNSLKYKYFFWNFLEHDTLQDEEVYLILFSVAWIELRCISFSLEYVERNEKNYNENEYSILETLIDMLSYVFYLPFLYTGPVILYKEFENSFKVKNGNNTIRFKRFIKDNILFNLYTFLLDIAFHYIYFFAMQSEMETIKQLPTFALCGGGLWMGLEFQMKYVISYGTTASFARLDHLDPPPTPRCISRVHVYSQMWRHFDVGLYRFLVRYIYKPCYNLVTQKCKFPQMISKQCASLAAFIFIFIWHGTIRHIFIWSLLNYLGITLEYLGKAISETENYKTFKRVVLRSDEMEVRFIAMMCTPLLGLSAISNFYLFAGSEVGDLFFSCFIQPSLYNSIFVCLALYCCCHVSIALEDIPSRTDMKKDVQKALIHET